MLGLKRKRRQRLRETPLSAESLELLDGGVPYYGLLPCERQRELVGLVQVFLDEKRFEGCRGLEITDEVRLTIAGNACVLLLGRPHDFFPRLESILVYPNSFVAPVTHHNPDGTVSEGDEVRSGESWGAGSVVLAWEDIAEDLWGEEPGYNVIVHEFAHQLDDENPGAEGMPVLPEPAMAVEWQRVLSREYDALAAAVKRRKATLLDWQGAESPAEFFAVATEAFFTLPCHMAELHPDLYRLLVRLYAQDPAAICRAAGVEGI
jgi:Mlc titration factor MtfA (ptsG expression regulator)